MVPDGVLQDALKQHGQLAGSLIAILFSELHHRVLHDVKSSVLIANREQGLLERAPFDRDQEVREFLAGCQMLSPQCPEPPLRL